MWGLRAMAVLERGRAADGESEDGRAVRSGCVPIASAGLNEAGLTAVACERWRHDVGACLPDLRAGRNGDMASGEWRVASNNVARSHGGSIEYKQ